MGFLIFSLSLMADHFLKATISIVFTDSADLMSLEVPVSRSELHDRVVDLASRNGISRGYTKLVLTGGYADDGYTPGKNNLFILQHGDVTNDPSNYTNGITPGFAKISQRPAEDQNTTLRKCTKEP